MTMILSLCTAACVQLVFGNLLLHPVHETECEVEWNAKTKRVEVAMRLDILDEQWIAKRLSKKSSKDWQADVVRTQLWFDPRPDEKRESGLTGRPISWVGREEKGSHVWWYFEVVCEDGRPPNSVQTRLLFDRHQDYRHRIIVLGRTVSTDGKRPVVVLTNEKPKATLKLTR